MDCRMLFIIHGVDIGSLRDQVFDNDSVAGNDRQMQRGVALLVPLVDDGRVSPYYLRHAVQVLVLGTVMQRGLSRSVRVSDNVRLKIS